MSTFSPFLWRVAFPAGSGQASGRLQCHAWVPGGQLRPGPHHNLRGLPRNPPGLLSVLLLLDPRTHLPEHLRLRCPAGGGSGSGHWVTARPRLWDDGAERRAEPPRRLWSGPDFLPSFSSRPHFVKSLRRHLDRGANSCPLASFRFLSCVHSPCLPPETVPRRPVCLLRKPSAGS